MRVCLWRGGLRTAFRTTQEQAYSLEQALSVFNADAIIGIFGTCCMAAAPRFAGCTKDEAELHGILTRFYEFYKIIGMEAAMSRPS